MSSPSRGVLIAFEGIDGCGKSTQIERLAAWLTGGGRRPEPVLVLREPGGTPLGEDVRELLLHGHERTPLAETLLYMAARAELYATVIVPALERGGIVLMDRSHYSTVAYQVGGLGVDAEFVHELARRATRGRAPDRVVLLEIDAEDALRRRRAADDDRIEGRGAAYYERVADAYRRLAAAEPGRFVVVPGAGSPEEVQQRIREGLADVL